MTDDERRSALRRMRTIATSLLVLAAIVYALTIGDTGAMGYVNAAAEAAMVGAVADWFAVTALFRHPLKLPIPHTALIPRRKEALGKSLEQFVAENFLAEEVVRDKVVRAGIPRRVGSWLTERGGAARVVDEASTVLTGALGILRDEEVTNVLDQVVVRRLGAQSWSPTVGRLLGEVVADGTHHPVVDLTLAEAQRWLRANEDRVRTMVTGRAPLWVPDWLNDRLGKRVYTEAQNWVDEVVADRDSAGRKAIDDLLARYADALQNDPETRAKADEFQQRLLNSPAWPTPSPGCGPACGVSCSRRSRTPRPRCGPAARRPWSTSATASSRTRCSPSGSRGTSPTPRGTSCAASPRNWRRSSPTPWPAGTVTTRPSGSSCTSVATCSSSASTARSWAVWSGSSSTRSRCSSADWAVRVVRISTAVPPADAGG